MKRSLAEILEKEAAKRHRELEWNTEYSVDEPVYVPSPPTLKVRSKGKERAPPPVEKEDVEEELCLWEPPPPPGSPPKKTKAREIKIHSPPKAQRSSTCWQPLVELRAWCPRDSDLSSHWDEAHEKIRRGDLEGRPLHRTLDLLLLVFCKQPEFVIVSAFFASLGLVPEKLTKAMVLSTFASPYDYFVYPEKDRSRLACRCLPLGVSLSRGKLASEFAPCGENLILPTSQRGLLHCYEKHLELVLKVTTDSHHLAPPVGLAPTLAGIEPPLMPEVPETLPGVVDDAGWMWIARKRMELATLAPSLQVVPRPKPKPKVVTAGVRAPGFSPCMEYLRDSISERYRKGGKGHPDYQERFIVATVLKEAHGPEAKKEIVEIAAAFAPDMEDMGSALAGLLKERGGEAKQAYYVNCAYMAKKGLCHATDCEGLKDPRQYSPGSLFEQKN